MTSGSINFDVRSAEFLADPYPFYAALRQHSPVVYLDEWGAWFVTSYDGCRTLFRENRLGHAAAPENPFIFQNPPEHTRLRRLTGKVLTKDFIESKRRRVQEIMDGIVDEIESRDEIELMSEVAFPFPLKVIADFFDYPVEDYDKLLYWAHAMELCFDPLQDVNHAPEIEKARNEFALYLQDMCKRRMANPGPDMLTGLMTVEHEGDRLSPQEVISTSILLLVAGYITTANLIGNGTLALLRNPDQLQKLRDNPGLRGTAVEELLRYEPPGQIGHRFVMVEDVTYRDWTFKKGDLVFIVASAGNRDPDEFENPDTLDITRKPNPHLGFGAGIHACLGAVLGHLEGEVFFDTFLRRIPSFSLTSQKPQYYPTFVFRALKSLPIKIGD